MVENTPTPTQKKQGRANQVIVVSIAKFWRLFEKKIRRKYGGGFQLTVGFSFSNKTTK